MFYAPRRDIRSTNQQKTNTPTHNTKIKNYDFINQGITPYKPHLQINKQITLIGKAKVNLITIALTNREIKPNMELALESLETNGIKETILDVPQISQKKFTNKSLRNRICSPTCLTMALKYFGKNITLRDTLQGVYDNNSNTYGVWPLNTAYASELGVNCCFVRVASLAQAEAEILQKRPLIISISFKKGELKNSPLIETKGHLIVLVGITPKGDFYVFKAKRKK